MDNFIYANACKTTLADDITNVQTTIRVSNPVRLPISIPLGQVLVLTIHPDGLPSTQEIVHCTAISSDVLTVVRGAQGTAAASWPEGSVIGAYLTAEMLKQIADDVRGHAGSGGAAHAQATITAAGFMSAADKTKLNGIQVGATNYQHPVTHSPTVIAQDANNRFVTDTEKANWNAAKNHADSPHAPANAQKNSDITKEEIEAKLTGQIGSHSHADCDTVDGFHAQKTPAADRIPVADANGKLNSGWLPINITYPISIANGGTGSGVTPTASNSPQADNIKAVKHDHGHGGVGSLCFAGRGVLSTTTIANPGGTVSGSTLKAAGVVDGSTILHGTALSGTWRCLGFLHNHTEYYNNVSTLWQRIA